MKTLGVVAHTPSENTALIAQALYKSTQQIHNIHSQLRSPFNCDAKWVTQQDALIIFSTENFGYMSGALKDFFDRIYYPCLDKTQGKPYGIVIRAGNDGTGCQRAIKNITQGLQWKLIQTPLISKGVFTLDFLTQCSIFSQTIAAGIAADFY